MKISQFWQILVVVASWVNQHLQDIIEYLNEENQIFKEQLRGNRYRFTNDQRIRLASKGKALGCSVLTEVAQSSHRTPSSLGTARSLLKSGTSWYYEHFSVPHHQSSKR